VGGQLLVGPVQLRVVQVGSIDPGLQVVRHQAAGDPAEEGERLDVAGHPGPLVHLEHRPDEHVPRAGQDHDERPHPPQALQDGVEPRAEEAVVDLGLLAGGHLRTGRRGEVPGPVLGELAPAVAPEAGDADGQSPLVAEALVHGGGGVGAEHLLDLVPVGVDGVVGEAAATGIDQLGEPLPDHRRPRLAGQRWPSRRQARRLGLGHVLANGAPVHPEALGDHGLLPAGVPVHQDLHDVAHFERSPCHRPPRSSR
jgi:hypothetical protein